MGPQAAGRDWSRGSGRFLHYHATEAQLYYKSLFWRTESCLRQWARP
jgi:hypothetical protein